MKDTLKSILSGISGDILLQLMAMLFELAINGLAIMVSYNILVSTLFTFVASLSIIPMSIGYIEGVKLAFVFYCMRSLFKPISITKDE